MLGACWSVFQASYVIICFVGYDQLRLIDQACGTYKTIRRDGYLVYRDMLLQCGIGLAVWCSSRSFISWLSQSESCH
jgi:hypothetical protein